MFRLLTKKASEVKKVGVALTLSQAERRKDAEE